MHAASVSATQTATTRILIDSPFTIGTATVPTSVRSHRFHLAGERDLLVHRQRCTTARRHERSVCFASASRSALSVSAFS